MKVVLTKVAKYPKYLNCWISYPLLISAVLRERRRYQIGWIFGKFPKGEGSFSIQKFMLQILGTLDRAFWSENWNWQNSNFRVQGMLFSTLYCITIVHLYNKIVQLYCITPISIYCTLVQYNCTTVLYYAYIWKSCACIPYYPAIITPCIYATISVIKICHIFSKNEGGGSKAVWIFSKNSSHSVAGPFP